MSYDVLIYKVVQVVNQTATRRGATEAIKSLKERGVSAATVARRMGISRSHLSRLLKGDKLWTERLGESFSEACTDH